MSETKCQAFILFVTIFIFGSWSDKNRRENSLKVSKQGKTAPKLEFNGYCEHVTRHQRIKLFGDANYIPQAVGVGVKFNCSLLLFTLNNN